MSSEAMGHLCEKKQAVTILMNITVKETDIKDSHWCVNCCKLEKSHREMVWKRIEVNSPHFTMDAMRKEENESSLLPT